MPSDRILVVDDDPEIRKLLTLILQEKGFTVTTAGDCVEALRLIRERPAILILDLLLPDGPGEDICRAIKLDPSLCETIIIIVTALNDLESKLRCFELGAEEYLVKPVQLEELVARIARFLRLREEWKLRSSTQSIPITQTVERAGPQQEIKSKYGVYRIESLAGKGGMGNVYRAFDEMLDRYVAVKVLSREWASSAEFLERFKREAKLIAAVNHPGIAQIYTFAEEDGESYFALQWCSGGSLSNLMRKEGKINLLPALDIIVQCARALEAAWNRGVVHRDIKPSNVMFDDNQQIKIVDFGVAFSQKIPDSAGSNDQVIGSPAYMAPEHARGDNTDQRTDIYSLGITFYNMLYGRLPFPARSPIEWISKHASQPFPPFDPLDGKISPAAYRIIAKMTEKQPERRYQKYSELLQDLEAVRKDLYLRGYLKVPAAVNLSSEPSIYARSFYDLLAEIYQQAASGVVTVSWGPLRKKFLIARNEIVLFESPQSDENFWNMLVARNLMKREAIPASDIDLEESLNRLLSQKALSPEDFKSTYQERMKSSAVQVFLWPVCEAQFFKARIEHDAFSRIPVPRLLMEAARTFIPYDYIHQQVPKDHYLRRTPRFNEALEELNLPRSEMFMASRLEEETVTADTLQLLTGFSSEQVVRFIYGLKGLGALQYRIPTSQRRPRRVDVTAT